MASIKRCAYNILLHPASVLLPVELSELVCIFTCMQSCFFFPLSKQVKPEPYFLDYGNIHCSCHGKSKTTPGCDWLSARVLYFSMHSHPGGCPLRVCRVLEKAKGEKEGNLPSIRFCSCLLLKKLFSILSSPCHSLSSQSTAVIMYLQCTTGIGL